MKIEVGSVINELRIKQNSPRQELDNDICEPNALSDYARSIHSPTIDEWALFADKLKVDLPYFFTSKNEAIYNYIGTIKLLINKFSVFKKNEEFIQIA